MDAYSAASGRAFAALMSIDRISALMLSLFGAVAAFGVLYAVIRYAFPKNGGNTLSAPRVSADNSRYDSYIETRARITAIEEQQYTVYPYTPKESKIMEINGYNDHMRSPFISRSMELKNRREHNELAEMRNRRLAAGEKRDAEPIRKTRYRVIYDFESNDGRSFSGETIIFNKTDEYETGKYIDIKYKPSNPMANFPSSKPPII